MPRNTLEYTSPQQEDYQPDRTMEWKTEAVTPLVEALNERNRHLLEEITREHLGFLNGDKEKSTHLSWLDGHAKDPNSSYQPGFETRDTTKEEIDLLLSYHEAARNLDGDQADYLAGTLAYTMTNRAQLTFQQNFGEENGYTLDPNTPHPESHQKMMDAARTYFQNELEHTQELLKHSFNMCDSEQLTAAVDDIRLLEKDMGEAMTGFMPKYTNMMSPQAEAYGSAYMERGEALTEGIQSGFQEAHPGLDPHPEGPEFTKFFKDATKDYPAGDTDNAAGQFAYDYMVRPGPGETNKVPRHQMHPESSERYHRIYENLSGR